MGKTGTPAWASTWKPPKLTRRGTPKEIERFVLFVVDEVEYTAPVSISPGTALTVLQVMGDEGLGSAILSLLRLTIGQEALDALAASTDLEKEQLTAILDEVQKAYLGQVREITSGN